MHYDTEFELSFDSHWVFKVFLINGSENLIMSAKLATPSLLKTTLIWSKGLGIII